MMKKLLYLLPALLFLNLAVPVQGRVPGTKPTPEKVNAMKRNTSLSFIENKGQLTDMAGKPRPDILFTANSGNTQLFLNSTGIHYQFTKTIYPKGYNPMAKMEDTDQQAALVKQVTTQTHRFSLELAGASSGTVIRKENKSRTVYNYYLAGSLSGVTGVASYEKIVYENIYPHIDWVVYSQGKNLKYDFVIHPGGDPARIKLNIKDAESVSITEDGELLMTTSLGEIREKAPLSYADGREVPSHFKLNSDGTIGFDVKPAPGSTLVIDPVVMWATYFGGADYDAARDCDVDASGNVYIAGYAASASGIANGGFQNTLGGNLDAYLAKFDASGYLIWATYYGSTGDELGRGCATDGNGDVYLAGTTTSSGLAYNGFQNTYGGGSADAFLVKFNAAGARLWATYYGGSSTEGGSWGAQKVCTDNDNNVYFAGQTESAGLSFNGFQNTLAYQGVNLTATAFLVKFSPAGNRLWATYCSGSQFGLVADNNGYVYITGDMHINSTGGSYHPVVATSNSFQPTAVVGRTAYLVKLNAVTGARVWGTNYGYQGLGNGNWGVNGGPCIVDGSGNVYLTGYSANPNLATTGTYQSTLPTANASCNFIVKFNASCQRLWATYYGGPEGSAPHDGFLDASGNVFLMGMTYATTGMAFNGFQNTFSGGSDGFIAKFDPSGTSLLWGSYFGGPGYDEFAAGARDASGNIYLSGQTDGTSGIGIPGTYQPTYAGASDGYLLKVGEVNLITDTAIAGPLCSGSSLSVPFTLSGIYNSGNIFTAQLSDALGSFASPVNIGTLPGTAAGTINATIPSGTIPGTGYRIRIVSSSPAIIAPNNGSNLTIGTSGSTTTVTETICSNLLPYTWHGITIPAGGTAVATVTIPNLGGCDSILVLDLVITPAPAPFAVMDTTCRNSFPYIWNGITVNAPAGNTATAIYTGLAANGCDSIVTLDLHVLDTTAHTDIKTYCSSELPLNWNGITIPANATTNAAYATYNTTNAAGCDSIVTLNLTVTPSVSPSVAITANPGSTICTGTAVTYTASPVNGGTTPVYQWKKNNINVGSNTATYTDNTLLNGDVITLELTSSMLCAGNGPVSSPAVTMTVNPVLAPSVTITANTGNIICGGQIVTFTAIPANGGSGPVYQWQKNGINVGTNSAVYIDNVLANGDVVTVIMTGNAPCTPATPVTSTGITMSVNTQSPVVTLAASPGNTICAGTPVTFTTTTAQAGPNPIFVWKKNGVTVGGNTPAHTDNALIDGDVITVTLINTAACASFTPVAITMNVITALPPAVTISSSPGSTICAGTPVTFTATPVNGGTLPLYQWKKNGTIVGTGSPTYTDNALANGDILTADMTANAACAITTPVTSNGITMTVNPSLTATVTLAIDPGNNVCEGMPVTFTATTANGGSNPSYQWKKNTLDVGANSNIYIENTPVNGDIIMVTVTHPGSCIQPAASPATTLSVSPVAAPSVTITVTPGTHALPGTAIVFNAYAVNGGSNPDYQWYHNGLAAGSNQASYTPASWQRGDNIYCTITSSDACAQPQTGKSNILIMQATTGIGPNGRPGHILSLYPNPNTGSFTLEGTINKGKAIPITIVNVTGQQIYSETAVADNGKLNKEIQLPGSLANGVYLLRMHTDTGTETIRFVLER